jgi:hypothetical protein
LQTSSKERNKMRENVAKLKSKLQEIEVEIVQNNSHIVSVKNGDAITASNYSSSGFAYNCSDGTPITGTCSCATGYTDAGCSDCDTANGYVSSGGACVPTCTIPPGSGTTLTRVARGTTSTVCNSGGYCGTLSYKFSSGRVPISVTTPCL